MDLEKEARAGLFLDEISLSVKKIIFASFPGLTEQEKEEIDQDVKFKLLKMAARGKKVVNLRSYVWKMVYSTALDVIAGRSQALRLDDLLESERSPLQSCVDELSPEYLFEEKELLALVVRVIEGLPKRRRAAVLLHLQGLSLEETAVYLGESLSAARHLLYRGLEDLRENLAKRSDGRLARRGRKTRSAGLELKRT